jgi:hypothetical protein
LRKLPTWLFCPIPVAFAESEGGQGDELFLNDLGSNSTFALVVQQDRNKTIYLKNYFITIY